MSEKIVCIGDSNTWGYDPRNFGGERYPATIRWTALLNARPDWDIVVLGENGRSIPHNDFELRMLDLQLNAIEPFDGICIMLGSNDLLCGVSPVDAAAHMEKLLDRLTLFKAPLLLVAPPHFCSGTWVSDERLIDASAQLGCLFEELAQHKGVAFANAGAWDIPLAYDGVHISEKGHLRFAVRIGKAFRQAFCE